MEHLQCAKRQTYKSEQECHDSSGGKCGLLNMLVCVSGGGWRFTHGWNRGCCGSIQDYASLATLGGLRSCLEEMAFNMRL